MRRRGQSEERRRRVLKDDLSGGGKVDPRDGTPPPRSAEAYPASALQDQPRISDLLPRSAWTLLALGIGGASVIGGLLVGYHKLQPALHPQHAIFDLSGTGGLANWWAACLLGMVAIVAGVCYSLRRYKLTDYHGRYR
ncbi:MAG: hypothetical protein GTO03_12605, partial [Planctomycetales bacterium]|nr:hypothetical protein [Planctomycetales bacterium]